MAGPTRLQRASRPILACQHPAAQSVRSSYRCSSAAAARDPSSPARPRRGWPGTRAGPPARARVGRHVAHRPEPGVRVRDAPAELVSRCLAGARRRGPRGLPLNLPGALGGLPAARADVRVRRLPRIPRAAPVHRRTPPRGARPDARWRVVARPLRLPAIPGCSPAPPGCFRTSARCRRCRRSRRS